VCRRDRRVDAIIVQNAVSHEAGLGSLWETRRRYWANRGAHVEKLRANLISPEAARQRHLGNDPHPEQYDPDAWTDESAFLCRPGQDRIQEDLFYDYRTNVAAYPTWQAYLREQPPPLLVLGGQVRSILYRRGGVGSPAGCQGRGNPCPRGRPLRHGYEERRGVSPCIEVPRPASPLASKAGRVRAGLERARHANAWRAFCLQAP